LEPGGALGIKPVTLKTPWEAMKVVFPEKLTLAFNGLSIKRTLELSVFTIFPYVSYRKI
jgi:hypothetical protein